MIHTKPIGRPSKTITASGRTQTAIEWGRELGISPSAVYSRLEYHGESGVNRFSNYKSGGMRCAIHHLPVVQVVGGHRWQSGAKFLCRECLRK